MNKLFESEKGKYLAQWEALNTHLTSVEHDELEYQKNETILSLDSGRLIKSRFSGFNDGKYNAIPNKYKDIVFSIICGRSFRRSTVFSSFFLV